LVLLHTGWDEAKTTKRPVQIGSGRYKIGEAPPGTGEAFNPVPEGKREGQNREPDMG